MNNQLVGLYEIKRQSFLIGFIQNPAFFDKALAYAYYNRVAPIFHENDIRETYESDPFAEVYAVKASFVDEVTKFIDRCWLDDNLQDVEFNSLENKFGGYKVNRVELISVLEYARIHGLFDDAVWKAVMHRAPMEANHLASTFSPKDVHFN